MNLCIPTANNSNLESRISDHFGSAPYFMIVDTSEGQVITTVTRDNKGKHGSCQPIRDLAGQQIDAIAVNAIGNGALKNLQRSGVTIYRSVGSTIKEVLAILNETGLQELSPAEACGGHGHSHRHGSHHEFGCGF